MIKIIVMLLILTPIYFGAFVATIWATINLGASPWMTVAAVLGVTAAFGITGELWGDRIIKRDRPDL
jgi:hypothetical protein